MNKGSKNKPAPKGQPIREGVQKNSQNKPAPTTPKSDIKPPPPARPKK